MLETVLALLGMRSFVRLGIVCKSWHRAAARLMESWSCLSPVAFDEGPEDLKHPTFVAQLPDGSLAISEMASHTEGKPWRGSSAGQVRVVASRNGNGAPVPILEPTGCTYRGVAVKGWRRPTGIAVSDDAVYIGDEGLKTVHRYRLRTQTMEVLHGAHPSGYGWSPYGLALTGFLRQSSGDEQHVHRLLLISDSRSHDVVVVHVESRAAPPPSKAATHFYNVVQGVVGSGWWVSGSRPATDSFDHPRGVAYHPHHGVVVADRGNDFIKFFGMTGCEVGDCVREVGGAGEAPGRFLGPYGVVFVGDDRLVVSEFEGRRVQVLTPQGAPLQVLPLPGTMCATGVIFDAAASALYVAAFLVRTGTGRLYKYAVASSAAPTATEAPLADDSYSDGGMRFTLSPWRDR